MWWGIFIIILFQHKLILELESPQTEILILSDLLGRELLPYDDLLYSFIHIS